MTRGFDHIAKPTNAAATVWRPAVERGGRAGACLEAAADRTADQIVSGGTLASVDASINAGGQPLDPNTRGAMEGRFTADFSGVRIFADNQAAGAANRLDAQAYTQGEDIVFGAGQYRPDSQEGLHLLAHELAHVVQQRADGPRLQRKPAAKPVPAAHTKSEDAEKDLKKRFGIAGIDPGDSQWSVEQLNTTLDALAKLPPGDIAALKGVVLQRAKALAHENKKLRDGEFVTEQKVQGTTVTNKATLRLADSAFADPTKTAETILHETGHAVASKTRRDAFHQELKATAKFNEKTDKQNETAGERTSTHDVLKPLVDEANVIKAEVDELLKQRSAAVKAGDKAAVASVDAQLAAAKKRHAEKIKEAAPARTAFNTAEAADKAALAAKKSAEDARDAAKVAADATKTGSETKRVKKFVDFVNEKAIDPITPYAKANWPAKPEEFYADAYSLFLTDADALKAKSEDLYNWFKKGSYK